MPTHFAAPIRTLLVIGAFCPALAGARTTEVNVIVDFTPAGRKVAHPSPGNPAYYFPVLGSFEELGAGVAGETPPVPWNVAHVVALELARQGYLEMSPSPYVNEAGRVTYRDGTVVTVPPHPIPASPLELNAPGGIALTRAVLDAPDGPYSARGARSRSTAGKAGGPSFAMQALYATDSVHGPVMSGTPSLILSIQYGYANPESVNFDAGSINPLHDLRFNQLQMLGLVVGNNVGKLDGDFNRESIMQRIGHDRYFVMVSAYDFESYRASHKVVMLWKAKMSAPTGTLVEFSDALDALARAGGPFFGRETVRPATVTLPITPDGHVEVGTPTIEDYSYVLRANPPAESK